MEISSLEIAYFSEHFCKQHIAIKLLIKLQKGDAFLANFSVDDKWYRAVVEESDAENVKVRFIDFGNAENIPISEIGNRLKILKDEELLKLPSLAFPITLTGNIKIVERSHFRIKMFQISKKRMSALYLKFCHRFNMI